jgi:hypothetical protein
MATLNINSSKDRRSKYICNFSNNSIFYVTSS